MLGFRGRVDLGGGAPAGLGGMGQRSCGRTSSREEIGWSGRDGGAGRNQGAISLGLRVVPMYKEAILVDSHLHHQLIKVEGALAWYRYRAHVLRHICQVQWVKLVWFARARKEECNWVVWVKIGP